MFYPSILGWCVLGYLGGLIAARKGYSPRSGIVLGVLFGPLGLIVAALLPTTQEGRDLAKLEGQIYVEAAADARHKECPACNREVSARAPVCPRCNHRFAS